MYKCNIFIETNYTGLFFNSRQMRLNNKHFRTIPLKYLIILCVSLLYLVKRCEIIITQRFTKKTQRATERICQKNLTILF